VTFFFCSFDKLTIAYFAACSQPDKIRRRQRHKVHAKPDTLADQAIAATQV
jgi:hypothetical protein